MPHVLVVDDEPGICWGLTKLAGQLGHTAEAAGSAEQGLDAIHRRVPDLVMLDVRLPGMDGLSALGRFHERLGPVPIVIMTAFGQLETAVEAIRRGAFDYLVKPFDLTVVERTLERAFAFAPPSAASPEAAPEEAPQIIGQSPAMQAVFKQIALVSPTSACVHLHGESGTGKELVARAIHRYGPRAGGPFVPVNLAALNPALAESELFGHVRGAFTGADQTRAGLLEQAHGGTIFLDEVADVPAALQVKILRALEHGEIWPVGSNQPRRSDFRLISATHQDLRELVQKGGFRHDLYYRLITFQIDLPPLRDRRGDVPLLAGHFVETLSQKHGTPRPGMTEGLLAELERRPWLGNVRELSNALEHALILARGEPLVPAHLPPVVTAAMPGDDIAALLRAWTSAALKDGRDPGELYEDFLKLVEPPLLEAVLQESQGQILAAAKRLGLHRTTVSRKLQQHGLG